MSIPIEARNYRINTFAPQPEFYKLPEKHPRLEKKANKLITDLSSELLGVQSIETLKRSTCIMAKEFARLYLKNPNQFLASLLDSLVYGLELNATVSAPNLLLPLIFPESLQLIWQRTRQLSFELGIRVDFANLQYDFDILKPNYHSTKQIEGAGFVWSTLSIISNDSVSIPGPIIVAHNHKVMASPIKSEEHKRLALAMEMLCYLIEYGACILAIPKRAEGSLTHRLLLEYNPKVVDISWTTHDITQAYTLYFVSFNEMPEKLKPNNLPTTPLVNTMRQKLTHIQHQKLKTVFAFDLRAEQANEMCESILADNQLLYYLQLILMQHDDNFSAFLKPWLSLRNEVLKDTPTIADWVETHLDTTTPLRLNISEPTSDTPAYLREMFWKLSAKQTFGSQFH